MVHASPRKVIPLNDLDTDRERPQRVPDGPASVTRRAFFCGVVVETDPDGRDISQDVREIVAALGEPLTADANGKPLVVATSEPTMASSSSSESLPSGPIQRKRAMTTGGNTALANTINEFVVTERSYVKHLRIMKESYADPLRKYARSKDTAIISSWDANTLFGNLDQLLSANEAFLTDLEKMLGPNGHKVVGGIGDVTLKHFKDLKGFECYRHYYAKREDAQRIFQREMLKKSTTGFAGYIERIKDTTVEKGNRLPLRELLIEPVQRIPRYTMMFKNMIKYMSPTDPQRSKLVEADALASKIASCETDDQTKRVAALLALPRTIEGCPADIVSDSRRLIDCIDVTDVLIEPIGNSSDTPPSLPCTLLLFNDKLMLVRRPAAHLSGRQLAGLDEVDKATRLGTLPNPALLRRNGLVCKGVFEITEVVVTDVGGIHMHMFLEVPPQTGDLNWSGRQFRAMTVGTGVVQLNPQATAAAKVRFIENLWTAQALFRTRQGRSVVLQGADSEVESRNQGRKLTVARAYYNVYQRRAYLGEQKKSKVILHVDQSGTADPVPFGVNGSGPFVVIRVQPLEGEVSRYTVSSDAEDDNPVEDIVHTSAIPDRVLQTIQQYGLFKFQTGPQSRPSTPTASTRSRANIFSLDAISRNIFGSGASSRSGASVHRTASRRRAETDASVISSPFAAEHRRTRSTTSRSSSQTRTTADSSLLKSSLVSNSTNLTLPDEDGVRSVSPGGSSTGHGGGGGGRKLVKRSKSPGACSLTEDSQSEVEMSHRRTVSAIEPRAMAPVASMSLNSPPLREAELLPLDASEWDLVQRLELARRNSKNQHGSEPTKRERDALREAAKGAAETIFEEDRPAMSLTRGRAAPRGPRSPQSPHSSDEDEAGDMDVENQLERTLTEISAHDTQSQSSPPESPARKKRMLAEMEAEQADTESDVGYILPSGRRSRSRSLSPLKRQTMGNTASLMAGATAAAAKSSGGIEPLLIKKKTSTSSERTEVDLEKRAEKLAATKSRSTTVVAPMAGLTRAGSTDRGRVAKAVTTLHLATEVPHERLLVVAETTREDIQSCRRAVKRIKLEFEQRAQGGRPVSPTGIPGPTGSFPRSAPSRHISAQAARMFEMRQMIAARHGDAPAPKGPPGPSPLARDSSSASGSGSSTSSQGSGVDEWSLGLESLVLEAEKRLKKAATGHEALQEDLHALVSAFKQKSAETDRLQAELQQAKVQCTFVKDQLTDVMDEKELMYEAFNKELDGMYEDANLPETEAWDALTRDLRQAKDARNEKERENEKLRLELAEMKLLQEQSLELLRQHKLVS